MTAPTAQMWDAAIKLLKLARTFGRGPTWTEVDKMHAEIDAFLRSIAPPDPVAVLDKFFIKPQEQDEPEYHAAERAWTAIKSRLTAPLPPHALDGAPMSAADVSHHREREIRASVAAEINQEIRLRYPGCWKLVSELIAEIGRGNHPSMPPSDTPRETINRLTDAELSAEIQKARDDEARLCAKALTDERWCHKAMASFRHGGWVNRAYAAAIERFEHRAGAQTREKV